MAITVGNTSSGVTAGAQTSLTFSHTVVGNLLLVTYGTDDNSIALSSITFSGQNMTHLETTSSSNYEIRTYYIINPPKVTGNVVITFASGNAIIGIAVDFKGVNTDTGLTFDTAIETSPGGTGTSLSLSPSSNTAIVPDMVYAASFIGLVSNQTPLNSQTEVADRTSVSGFGLVTGYKTAVDGNVTPIGWSYSSSGSRMLHAVAIRAAGVAVLPISDYNEMISTGATSNSSSGGVFRVGEPNNLVTSIRRTWIKPDYSSLPTDKILLESILTMTPTSDVSSNSRTIFVHRCLRATITNQQTWNEFSTGNNWGSGGCSNATTDYEGAVVIGSQTQPASPTLNSGGSFVIPLLTSEIQKFINNTYTNNGLVLFVDTQVNDAIVYASQLNATPEYRPRVVGRYAVPAEGGLFWWW
jgi:hypothetical protein